MKKLIFASLLMSSICLNATVIVAHRGENRLAPENSIEAANIAWKNGVKFVEADFCEISTGEIVCIHGNRELKKYTCVDKKIADLTASDIPTLNLAKGEKWKGKFDFVKVPTMQEIMATVPSDGTLVFEIKSYSDSYAKKLDDARQKAGLRKDQILIIAFNADYLKDFNSKYRLKFIAIGYIVTDDFLCIQFVHIDISFTLYIPVNCAAFYSLMAHNISVNGTVRYDMSVNLHLEILCSIVTIVRKGNFNRGLVR